MNIKERKDIEILRLRCETDQLHKEIDSLRGKLSKAEQTKAGVKSALDIANQLLGGHGGGDSACGSCVTEG